MATSLLQWFAIRCFALAALLCMGHCCLAQAITVRVIDAANHRPLTKQQVTVSLFYSGEDRHRNEAELKFTTDARGEAHFTLPEPTPRHIVIQIFPDDRKWECVCMSDFAPETLFQSGIVESAGKHRSAIAAKPGELVFALRKTSAWLRPFYPLYRD